VAEPLKRLLLRGAVRALAVVAGTAFLLFPHPGRALREARALRNPNALVNPDDPAVAKLSEEVDRAMPAGLPRQKQIAWIESFVDRRIVYANDWDQWANVDYWPAPAETLASGREDCDGIAVVTASLLRHRGFKAHLEASIQHVWVAVEGERILHPDAETNFGEEGWSLPSLREILSGLRYGLREFPFWRWALLAAWAVFALRWPNRARTAGETVVSVIALVAAIVAAHRFPDFLFAVVLLAVSGLALWTLVHRTPGIQSGPGSPDRVS